MRNFKYLLICVLLCSFTIKNLKAQYLKGMSRDWVLDLGLRPDTCEIFFYFGNAEFTKYNFTSTTLYDSNYKSIEGYELKLVNDSTLRLKFPAIFSEPKANWLLGKFYVRDEKDNYREIGNYQIQILRKDNSISARINNPINSINTDTLIDFVKLEIVGINTHFLEPNTTFHYAIENQFGSNNFDSVSVISNELAYLYLPIKSTHLIGTYKIYYTNKRDLTVNPIAIRLETEAYKVSKMRIVANPPVSKYYNQGAANASLYLELPQTEAFNPDTILLHLKGQIQLAHSHGASLPIFFESDSVLLDTGYWPWIPPTLKLYYNFKLPYQLPSGNYDLIFTHPQLPQARLLQPINIHRPNIHPFFVIFPGWPFKLNFSLKPKPSELAAIQFVFEANAGLYVDSIKFQLLGKDTTGIVVFGHSDSSTQDGQYDLHILQPNNYPIYLNDAIRVVSSLPQNIKFISNHLLNIGRIDSSKRILSPNLPSLINTNKTYLAPVRFLRNGTIDTSISIKAHPNFRSYGTVVFNVDSLATPGHYDAEIFDTLNQKWHLQKEAIYVMNTISRAVEISPKTVAYDGGGETRLYTCWFKNTHFSQAKEIRLGSYYHSPVVVNDTCLQFRGGNADPVFYNEIDGYIGNDFIMDVVYSPSITLFSPNWIAKGSRTKFTIHSDASNWTYFKEIQFHFRKNYIYETKLKTVSYTVINDTMLEFEVEAGDSLTGPYDLRIDQYPPNSFSGETIELKEALKVVPVGINEHIKGPNSLPKLNPNPNNGKFEITANNNLFQSYEIIDILGKPIASGSLDQNKNQLDLSQELKQPGIYFIKLSGEKTITLKFIFNP
jgi:hypothetical protein